MKATNVEGEDRRRWISILSCHISCLSAVSFPFVLPGTSSVSVSLPGNLRVWSQREKAKANTIFLGFNFLPFTVHIKQKQISLENGSDIMFRARSLSFLSSLSSGVHTACLSVTVVRLACLHGKESTTDFEENF